MVLRKAWPVLGMAAALAIAGCGGSSTSSSSGGGQASFYTGGTPGGTPVRGGTVTIDSGEAPTSFDPITAVSPGDDRPSVSVFDTLVELMPDSNEPQPALAQSWTVSSNGLTYTFKLRPGVRFSDGATLTSEDVAYSLLRNKQLSLAACQSFTKQWKAISAVGPLTVQMRLASPNPALIGELSEPCFGIVSKNVVAHESEKQFASHPIGTGPFMVKSTTPGNTTTTMVRNPYFWRSGKPYLDGLVFNQVESANARTLAVRSGTATLDIAVPYSQVKVLKNTPGVRMVIQPIWGASLNPINNTKPPLNDANVLKALLYATPYSEIIKSVYDGIGTQANSPWGAMKYWDSQLPVYPYDLAKARALLKSTPVPNGFPLAITVQGGETSGELLASILQSSWAKIGVHVSIHTTDSTALYSDFFKGKFEMDIFPPEATVNEVYDPTVAVKAYLSGEFAPVPSPTSSLKSLIERAGASQNQAERQRLYQEIQRRAYSEEPASLSIINLTSLNLASNTLRGYQVIPNGHMRMEEAWLAH